MIYKFNTDDKSLEIEQTYSNEITITIKNLNNDLQESIVLIPSQIYDLIGALHSVQTKIKNFKSK